MLAVKMHVVQMLAVKMPIVRMLLICFFYFVARVNENECLVC